MKNKLKKLAPIFAAVSMAMAPAVFAANDNHNDRARFSYEIKDNHVQFKGFIWDAQKIVPMPNHPNYQYRGLVKSNVPVGHAQKLPLADLNSVQFTITRHFSQAAALCALETQKVKTSYCGFFEMPERPKAGLTQVEFAADMVCVRTKPNKGICSYKGLK